MRNRYIVIGAVVVLLAVALYLITIPPPPPQAIIVEPKPSSDGIYRVIANKPITFRGQAQDNRGNIIEQGVEYRWDIDGEKLDWTEGNNSITHAFQERGKYYTVKLMVRRRGATGKLTEKQIAQLKVYVNLPPVAQALVSSPEPDFRDNQGAVPLRIEFDGSRSSDSDGRIVSWLWNFGDGQTSNEQNPSHRYDREGHYNIKLTVMDNMGEQGEAAISIAVVPNQPPTDVAIEVIGLKDGRVPRREASFQGKAIDPEGRALQFLWNFGDKGTSTEQNPIHKYADGGNYAVRLSVADDYNRPISVERSIYVNRPPVPIPSVTQAPDENQLTVLFDASKSYDPDPLPGSSLKYKWEFGDGHGRASELKGSYDYTKPGDYSVTLTVEDEGEVSQITVPVSVHTYLEKLLQDRIGAGIVEATLKDIYIAPQSKGSIILFEDIHRTSFIQQRIARSFIGLKDVSVYIGVEGLSRPLNDSIWIELSKIEDIRRLLPDLAWGWLVSNCISPAEYYAISTNQYSVLVAVEDAQAYNNHNNCLEQKPADECDIELEARDRAIVQNIVRFLEVSQGSKSRIVLMAIGANHISKGSITKALKDKKVSHYVLSPLGFQECDRAREDLVKCLKDSRDLKRCTEKTRIEKICGVMAALKGEYQAICGLISRNETPLADLLKWLSGTINVDPNKYGSGSEEFQKKALAQISLGLALQYFARGLTHKEVHHKLDEIGKRVEGMHFPNSLAGLDVRSGFTQSFQDPPGTTVSESYLILEGHGEKKAIIKLPEAFYSDQGIIKLGIDTTWSQSFNSQVEDLLTLPQNGPALADLFAALRTPGAAQTWEWQRADGSWVYARLSKRVQDEKEVDTITQITKDEYQKDLVMRLQPLLAMIKDKTTRNKLEADFNALRKLDAWTRYPIYPQILVLQVDNRLLLATRKGEKQEVKEMDSKVTAILKKLEPVMNEPVEYLLDRVLTPDERTLVIDTIKSLVAQWSPQVVEEIKVRDEEQIKEYRITLDLKGQPFIRFDLPENPVLRLLVPYLLRGNRAVGIAGPSTVLDIERKLASAFIDHNKLKLVFSLPWSKVNKLPEPYRSNIIQQYRDAIKGLQEKIKEHGLGIEVIDLTDLSPQEAKNKLTDLLQEKDNLVLTFWEAKDERTLEIGQDGSITQDEVESTKPVGLWVALRALSGCNSYRTRWPDIIIEKYGGVVSLGFWQEISIGDAFRLANKLVERLADELRRNPAPPSLIPLLLDILEGLPGLVVVEVPSEHTRG